MAGFDENSIILSSSLQQKDYKPLEKIIETTETILYMTAFYANCMCNTLGRQSSVYATNKILNQRHFHKVMITIGNTYNK